VAWVASWATPRRSESRRWFGGVLDGAFFINGLAAGQ
jgi:hypothetical protein